MDEQILNLSREHPIVHSAITAYEAGHCTYEEALEQAVIILSESNKRILEVAKNAMMTAPMTITVNRGDIEPW